MPKNSTTKIYGCHYTPLNKICQHVPFLFKTPHTMQLPFYRKPSHQFKPQHIPVGCFKGLEIVFFGSRTEMFLSKVYEKKFCSLENGVVGLIWMKLLVNKHLRWCGGCCFFLLNQRDHILNFGTRDYSFLASLV